ncbi:MAG TPA: TrmH family RNA methyltransferase [Candidatus Saccharimonadales bacterium]
MRTIILIAHNLRSTYNVGSLLRTADGLGVQRVYLTGYTPYPSAPQDTRLPHIAEKIDTQIHKTALDAETSVDWQHTDDVEPVIAALKRDGFTVAALEQSDTSVSLPKFMPPDKLALIVGREVEGIEPEILARTDIILEIPMFGAKESFNVVQAAAIALYHARFSAD